MVEAAAGSPWVCSQPAAVSHRNCQVIPSRLSMRDDNILLRIASLLIEQAPRPENQALLDSLCGIADNPELPENADAFFALTPPAYLGIRRWLHDGLSLHEPSCCALSFLRKA
jgi:hypothetical protein